MASDLGLYNLFMSHFRTLCLYWLNTFVVYVDKSRFFALFAIAQINVCFNVSFLDFNHIVNKKDNFGFKCMFFPESKLSI